MTENENSPENLRKFLESDDPALVTKGLSMTEDLQSLFYVNNLPAPESVNIIL